METMIYFAAILFVTFAGGVLACALDWLMLRFAFRLMRPAGLRPRVPAPVPVRSIAPAAARIPEARR